MIGCGAIARQYLDTARRLDAMEIVAVADRVPARATAVEAAEGIPAMPVADLLENAEVFHRRLVAKKPRVAMIAVFSTNSRRVLSRGKDVRGGAAPRRSR